MSFSCCSTCFCCKKYDTLYPIYLSYGFLLEKNNSSKNIPLRLFSLSEVLNYDTAKRKQKAIKVLKLSFQIRNSKHIWVKIFWVFLFKLLRSISISYSKCQVLFSILLFLTKRNYEVLKIKVLPCLELWLNFTALINWIVSERCVKSFLAFSLIISRLYELLAYARNL